MSDFPIAAASWPGPVGARLLLAVLYSHDLRGDRFVWPSVARLADLTGQATRTIERHLAALVAAGWIAREERGKLGSMRRGWQLRTPVERAEQLLEGDGTPTVLSGDRVCTRQPGRVDPDRTVGPYLDRKKEMKEKTREADLSSPDPDRGGSQLELLAELEAGGSRFAGTFLRMLEGQGQPDTTRPPPRRQIAVVVDEKPADTDELVQETEARLEAKGVDVPDWYREVMQGEP